MRAIFGLPLFALLGGAGLAWFLERLEKKRGRDAILALVLTLATGNVLMNVARYVLVFPETTNAWAPYAHARERIASMHGVHRVGRYERALVELYARDRKRRWLAPDVVELD